MSTATQSFGERLYEASLKYGRLCVGIDPHPQLLYQWGLEDNEAGLEEFCRICCDAFGQQVALVKPQVAFFERHGFAGMRILEHLICALQDGEGTLVLADAKRGDIGSTMEAYADAWLGPNTLYSSDAVTLSPYLGVGALAPAFRRAREFNKGAFVLAATSNPEARGLQGTVDREGTEGTTIAQRVVDEVATLNEAEEFGSFGVVVGATLDNPPDLRDFTGPVLLPGVGAQGASAADVDRITQGITHLAFPAMSRGILQAGPSVDDLRKAYKTAAEKFSGVPR